VCGFWVSGDFTGKLKGSHVHGPEEISTAFQESWIRSLLRSFESFLNSGPIGCGEPLNMTESTFGNDILADRLFHGQGKIRAYFHEFSATLYPLAESLMFPVVSCERMEIPMERSLI
jgi:hypothetical protein